MNVSNKDTWMSLCKKNIILLRPNIKQLVTLQTLQLCCNYLTFLPDEICELRNLSRFIVAKNRLKQLPGNIGLLRNLRELNVAGNALTSLPKSFTSLRQLTFLILNDNRISELSHELSGCISLKYLFVARNRIESLGAELMLLPFLKIIDYQSNPLEKNDFCAVQKDVYSLQELCARRIINCHTHIPVNTSLYIRNQLLKVRECFFCGGAFFDYWYEVNLSKVINETPVTFKAKLCKPHFRDQMEYVSKLLYLHDNRIGYHLCNENYPKISELFVLTSYLPRKLQEIRKFVKNKNKLPIDKIPLFTLIEGYDLINKEYVKYAGTLHRMTYKDDYRYSEPM